MVRALPPAMPGPSRAFPLQEDWEAGVLPQTPLGTSLAASVRAEEYARNRRTDPAHRDTLHAVE